MEQDAHQQLEALEALIERRSATQAEIDILGRALLDAYLAAALEVQAAVRALAQRSETLQRSDLIWFGQPPPAVRFRQTGDEAELRRALTLYAITEGRPDARDMLVGLSDLLRHAAAHGVDPAPIVRRVAAAADDGGQADPYQRISMRELLLRLI